MYTESSALGDFTVFSCTRRRSGLDGLVEAGIVYESAQCGCRIRIAMYIPARIAVYTHKGLRCPRIGARKHTSADGLRWSSVLSPPVTPRVYLAWRYEPRS